MSAISASASAGVPGAAPGAEAAVDGGRRTGVRRDGFWVVLVTGQVPVRTESVHTGSQGLAIPGKVQDPYPTRRGIHQPAQRDRRPRPTRTQNLYPTPAISSESVFLNPAGAFEK